MTAGDGPHGPRQSARFLLNPAHQAAHLAAVARKAKPMGSPGVIVIAKGAAKARMVAEIIRRGFVNQLVVDASLARALRALAKGGG